MGVQKTDSQCDLVEDIQYKRFT